MRAMAIMIITNVCAGQSFGVYSPYPTVLKVTTTNQRHTCKFHFEAGLSRWWMPHTLSEITSTCNNYYYYCSHTSNNFLFRWFLKRKNQFVGTAFHVTYVQDWTQVFARVFWNFHIASYSIELCVFWWLFTNEDTCDAYHKEFESC